ncbi:hypothetical protein [Singulisphaera sp. PoT]|uniref:hypothetical protein n=1 Tax=Singulisphaera sp. PoT TaxID=3411797 RepID=UPI003BF56FB1
MECVDYEARWNDYLDDRSAAAPELLAELEEHASLCEACRPLAQRYQTLLHVVSLKIPTPIPSLGFVESCLDAIERDREVVKPRRILAFPRRVAGLAAAALLLIALVAAFRFVGREYGLPGGGVEVVQKSDGNPSISEALATAGTATWDLARESSGSAAKIGREMLNSATLPPNSSSLFLTLSGPEANEVLEGVSERVNAGVRPLSDSAKQAFGFLLDAAEVERTVPPT